jgi:hypothetical protein
MVWVQEAAHRVIHEAVRADFDAADGFKEFGDGHGKKALNNAPIILISIQRMFICFNLLN